MLAKSLCIQSKLSDDLFVFQSSTNLLVMHNTCILSYKENFIFRDYTLRQKLLGLCFKKLQLPISMDGLHMTKQAMFYFHSICLYFTLHKLILLQMCLEKIDRLFKIQLNYKTLVLYEPHHEHLWYDQWNGAVPRFSQSLHNITCNSIYLSVHILEKRLNASSSLKN